MAQVRHSKRLKEKNAGAQTKKIDRSKEIIKEKKSNIKAKLDKKEGNKPQKNIIKVSKLNKRVSSISVPPSSPKSFLGNYNNVPGESSNTTNRNAINNLESPKNRFPDNVKDSFNLLKILQDKKETSKSYGIETKKKIVEEFTKDNLSVEKIVAIAKFKAKSQRVNKHPWSLIEIESLKRGVAKHGEGNWAKIRDDPEFPFHKNKKIRNNVAIKDKWRNVKYYIDYSARPIRYYALLDKFHRPYRTGNDNIKVYKNRWPRDAAMKAATKNEFYPTPEATETVIYVKEIPGTLGIEPESSLVHVYRAHRHREAAVNIDKFKNIKTVWQAEVEKVREEKILTRHEVFGEYQ